MKRLVISLLVMCAAGWASMTLAATSDTVGVINVRQIFTSSAQVKQVNKNLEAKFATKKKSLDALAKKLSVQIKDMQKNKSVMKAADYAKLETQVTGQEKSYRAQQMAFQQGLYKAQSDSMEIFMKKVKAAVKTVATKNHLSVVISNNNVLYSDNRLDVTNQVISSLK